ncbi:MAG: internal scaffolding protein [Microvirus sp.]|nr:MAG: internal scaffolding protein [Microvirus sp.]
MLRPFLRTEFNYDMLEASAESGLRCDDPSMAQQQFLEESDINTIVDRFGLNGQLPDVVRMPEYGDFTQVTDFQTAMNAVIAAQKDFMTLPAKVRSRFDNDPQKLLEFVADDSNRAEARALGLLKEVISESPPVVVAPTA